ncbi:hypothetical protein ACXR0O_07370 [Verrucomicrobiota bacterium sgz303538]
MKKHLIDVVFSPEDMTAVTGHLTGLLSKLEPSAFALDDDQRKRLQRLGLRNESFSRGVMELARQNPKLVPLTIDMSALERDIVAREQLLPALYQLQRITKLVEDTCIALGVDIYNGSRGLYKAMKVVAEINGISEIVEELGRRFARNTRTTQLPDAGSSSSTTPPPSA